MIEQLATRKSSEEIGLLEIVEQSKILEELKNIKSVELEKGSEKDILSYPVLVSVLVNEWDSFLMDSEGIYCVYTGKSYVFIKEDGENIASDITFETACPV